MKRNEELDTIVLEYDNLLSNLQIVSYEAANKLDRPRSFFFIKEAQEKGLETSLGILGNHIKTINNEIGNPEIQDVNAFVCEYRKQLGRA